MCIDVGVTCMHVHATITTAVHKGGNPGVLSLCMCVYLSGLCGCLSTYLMPVYSGQCSMDAPMYV